MDEVKAEFDSFYTSTSLSQATGINILHELKDVLDDVGVYEWQEVENFVKRYFNDEDAQTLPISVQKLQRALHTKAKTEDSYRFYALYDKLYRKDILAHAYAKCRANRGAPGVYDRRKRASRVWCKSFMR